MNRYRGAKLLENDVVIERAFVPAVVHIASVAPLMEMSLTDSLREHAWIEASLAPAVRGNGPGRVINIARRKLGFEIDAMMQGDGWIVVSQPAWPGWRAYIDGRRVEHQIADFTFIGIYVPAGRHQVRLVYWPESFVIGRGISAATLLGIVTVAVYRRARGRRKSRAA